MILINLFYNKNFSIFCNILSMTQFPIGSNSNEVVYIYIYIYLQSIYKMFKYDKINLKCNKLSKLVLRSKGREGEGEIVPGLLPLTAKQLPPARLDKFQLLYPPAFTPAIQLFAKTLTKYLNFKDNSKVIL